MAFYGRQSMYISSAKWTAVTAWAAATAYAAGDVRRQLATPSVGNERVFVCTVAGTSGGSEPSWTVTRGGSTTDNTVTWRECTGEAAMNGDTTDVATWNNFRNTNITLGHVCMNIAKTRIFLCTTSGNSNNTAEPTWNTTLGATTTDGTATWTCIGTTGSAWGAPHARLNNSLQSNWGDFPTYKFWVGSDHAETQSTSITFTGRGDSGQRVATGSTNGPIDIVCVDVAGSLPPVAADLDTTATITTTGSTGMTINGFIRFGYGITFTQGTSGGSDMVIGAQQNADQHWYSCAFRFGSGVGGAAMKWGGDNRSGRLSMDNCTLRFTSTNQTINMNTPTYANNLTIDTGGSAPSSLFSNNNNSARAMIRDSDLSHITNNIALLQNGGAIDIVDTKINDSASIKIGPNGPVADGGARGTMVRCGGSARPYQYLIWDVFGTTEAMTTMQRTGGASDGTNAYGWRMVSGPKTLDWGQYHEGGVMGSYNTTINSNITVTVYGIAFTTNFPTNQDIWMEVAYQGDASSDQGTKVNNRRATPYTTPTNHTVDSSSVWSAGATARQNSTAYTLGSVYKAASNPDRLFLCTASGISAASEPAAVATAVDGTSFSDGAATFKTGWRFSMAVTISSVQVKQAGPLYTTICLGSAFSTTTGFYYGIDPLPILT